MSLKKRELNISWQGFFAAAMFAMVMLYLFGLLVPLRARDMYNAYGIVLIAVCSGVYFSHRGLSGPAEIKLLLAFTAWTLITRWLNRDFYLMVDFDLVMKFLFSFLLFAVGTQLDSKQRERLLDVLTVLYAGFFVVASIVGIFIAVTNTYLHIPPEDVWITIKTEGDLNSLNLLSTHRLVSAGRLFIAWSLLIYQLLKRKGHFTRALTLVCIAIVHLAIVLLHSRNIQIVLSISYGMLVLLVFAKLLSKKPAPMRYTILPLVTAAAAVLCFYSFKAVNNLITELCFDAAPRFEAYYDRLENKPDSENFGIVLTADELAALSGDTSASGEDVAGTETPATTAEVDKKVLTDTRSILANKTMSGRTDIWKSGITVLKRNPSIGLYGRLSNFMALVNEAYLEIHPEMENKINHMHNVYLQALMLTGFPGLLLILWWTFMLVKDMLRLFFNKNDTASLAVKALTIPLTGMFIFGLAELIILNLLDLCGMCFYLIGGIFLGYYYDSFPRAKAAAED